MPSNDLAVAATQIIADRACPCGAPVFAWGAAVAHAEQRACRPAAWKEAARVDLCRQVDACSTCAGVGLVVSDRQGLAIGDPLLACCSGCGGVGTRQAELRYGGM